MGAKTTNHDAGLVLTCARGVIDLSDPAYPRRQESMSGNPDDHPRRQPFSINALARDAGLARGVRRPASATADLSTAWLPAARGNREPRLQPQDHAH